MIMKPRRQQIQSEKQKLEQENRAMEERLEALRITLQKQREARGDADITWNSGKRGALNSHVTKVLQESRIKKAGNVKFKILNGDGLGNPLYCQLNPYSTVIRTLQFLELPNMRRGKKKRKKKERETSKSLRKNICSWLSFFDAFLQYCTIDKGRIS
jgi:hypothetical protein